MRSKKTNIVTLFLAVILIAVLILGGISFLKRPKDIEAPKRDPAKSLIIILTLFFVATHIWKKEYGSPLIKLKKDPYHPTNYSAHSEFMNNDYLK